MPNSANNHSSERILLVSSDCHAGALPKTYNDYMPAKYHQAADDWWLTYAKEMIMRTGTFFDQEAVDEFSKQSGDEGTGKFNANSVNSLGQASEEDIRALLNDETSPFAPRRGEFDAKVRLKELEDDGIAGELIFPQMAPFGAGLTQYRQPIKPEYNLEGNRAYNRWLADLCSVNPGRHAGVAIINVDDIDVTVEEIKKAKEQNLFGGILLPISTGDYPFYHHPRYEPLWAICNELNMPIHVHSGWCPDYGDVPSATAMFISEVDMWAHRPFAALVWSGVFERYPKLKFVFTETGCAWILEALRVLEFKSQNPLFAHFKKGLSMSPSEYFQQNCYIGASFLPKHEIHKRHEIGLDKLMWGSDYPHMEGTWPNTMPYMRDTFAGIPEDEVRSMLGLQAAKVFDFDMGILQPIADRIGPTMADING